jgi:hypothetical protein
VPDSTTRHPAGYTKLFWRHRLAPEALRRQSFIREDHRPREIHAEDGRAVETFPTQYQPDGDDDFDHLLFALKYDGVDLLALARIAPLLDRGEITRRIAAKPTSTHGRRVFFLLELLSGERLDVPDLTQGNYCDVLDREHYFTSEGRRSRRHRVIDNLLGDAEFCPTVRKTPELSAAVDRRLDRRAATIAEAVDPSFLARTIRYLYTKETKSSFAIEHEEPGDRIERYLGQLASVGALPLDTEAGLTELQNSLVDPRFAERGFRGPGDDEVYVGQTLGFYERVHHVGLRSAETPALMSAWSRQRSVVGDGGPVVEAACRSFSFVFIHPFGDGNGRVHRLLLHHVLARRGYMPPQLVVPISSVIHEDLARYDTVLEDFSRRALERAELEYALDDDGRLTILRQASDLFRFPDLTIQAEATFTWLERAIEEDLPRELDFLRRFDEVCTRIREIVEMPDRLERLFIKICLNNNGRMSARKRGQFALLDDETIAKLEAVVRDAMRLEPEGVG